VGAGITSLKGGEIVGRPYSCGPQEVDVLIHKLSDGSECVDLKKGRGPSAKYKRECRLKKKEEERRRRIIAEATAAYYSDKRR
jgi:hypothetical protein